MLDQEITRVWSELDSIYGTNWGWCTADKARVIMNLVREVCSPRENPICVEIGVYGGKSLYPFALALKSIGRGMVYGIDPWDNREATAGYEGEHRDFWGSVDMDLMHNICVDGIGLLGAEDYTCLMKTTSDKAPDLSDLCVVHLDGQHTDQVSRDISRWAPAVVDGGYFMVNDIDWSEETRKAGPMLESMGFYLHSRVGGCAVFRKGSYSRFSTNPVAKPRLWIVDDFYEDPIAVRDFALAQAFDEGGIGRGYIGRRTSERFLFPGLKERFEQIIGMPITGWEDHGMNGRFQVAWAGEPLVYHCDSQRFAGMLFLTPGAPFQTGTTLYANKRNRARTFDDPGWDDAWKGGNHLDRTPFEVVDVAGNVFNRLVIFDGSCIHSASEYFGQDMQDGRLWHMFFFDA
jgi:hypothetical protein